MVMEMNAIHGMKGSHGDRVQNAANDVNESRERCLPELCGEQLYIDGMHNRPLREHIFGFSLDGRCLTAWPMRKRQCMRSLTCRGVESDGDPFGGAYTRSIEGWHARHGIMRPRWRW